MRSEQEIFEELRNLTALPGFAHVVAQLCLASNFTWYHANICAEDFAHMYSRARVIRTEMFTLIGLMVQAAPDYSAPAPPNVEQMRDRALALLEELHSALSAIWKLSDALKDAEVAAAQGAALREPIFYGGEGAFSFQYCALAADKYAADNDWLQANRGATIEQMVTVANAIASIQYAKVTAASRANQTQIGQPALLEAFIFTTAELAAQTGLDLTIVENSVAALAIPQEERNEGFKHLNDYNAVVGAPILRCGDRFLQFHFNALAEALYESPFYWMVEDKAYRPIAAQHRGDFTEQLALHRLQSVFGAARVFRGVNLDRQKGETIGEIDVLVLFSTHAIVVQAKSKRLTQEARRGNDLKIRKDFEAAVQSAYDQSMVCAEALLDKGVRLISSDGSEIKLDEPLRWIAPLCVVSDHYPALAFQADQFLVRREVAGVLQPLALDIFALDVMAELLSRPLRVLSYLQLRDKFRKQAHFTHETTLLGYHLKHNLWLTEYDSYLFEDDFAVDVEIAMAARRLGLAGDRTPKGILTVNIGSQLESLIAQIEQDPHGAMIELALLLYQLGQEPAKNVSVMLDRIIEDSRHKESGDFSIPLANTGLTVHITAWPPEQAQQRLRLHCEVRKYREKAESWYGIILRPGDGRITFGAKLAYPWAENAHLAEASRHFGATQLTPFAGEVGKVGRNDPCPCGSGKKYKKCHLR